MNWTAVYLVLLALYLSPGGPVITVRGHGEMTDMKVLERGENGQCSSTEERERARNEIHQIVNSVITTTFTEPTTTTASTTTMPSTTTSATTAFTTATTTPTMTGCSGPGWRQVAFINMTDTSYNCPTGLSLTSHSKRTCGRKHHAGCDSTTFSVGGLPYSRVCGRIRAYQFGATSAFHGYSLQGQGIDSYYVDGISLTHGIAGRRQHIWTFAAGLTEVTTKWPGHGCPCDTGNYGHVPAFVGNDYFCETGLHSAWNPLISFIFYPDDVLWDGQNCTSTSTCCQLNNPPWFTKNLINTTTDDIELRLCKNTEQTNDDAPIELIELYVQ